MGGRRGFQYQFDILELQLLITLKLVLIPHPWKTQQGKSSIAMYRNTYSQSNTFWSVSWSVSWWGGGGRWGGTLVLNTLGRSCHQ